MAEEFINSNISKLSKGEEVELPDGFSINRANPDDL